MGHDEIRAAVESNRDELLGLTERLVETPTVTGNEKPGQEIVIEYLESLGYTPDVWTADRETLTAHEGFFETSVSAEVGFEDRLNVAVRVPGEGDGRTLTIGGHMDVVDVDENDWTFDPWTLTRRDDTLYGRGVADMKGGLAACLIALRTLQEEDISLAGDVIFQSTIGEEAGGTGGALSALERGYRPDAAAIAEPFALPNVGIASAGVMYFKVRVPGKSVHAAWGHEGDNAIGNATLVYNALEALDEQRKAQIEYEPASRGDPALEGNVTNINVGRIEAGEWPSKLPGEAKMEGRVGWPPGESRADVRAEIEAAVASVAERDDWEPETPPTVEWFGWQARPHEVPTDADIATLARRVADRVTGETGSFVGGNAALDERFYQRYYDILAVSIGPAGHNLHGADEHTTVGDLTETAQVLTELVVEFCGETAE